MMLTRRDLDILNFLEDYRIASASTLTELFFPSLRRCQIRMKTLAVNGRVKRARLTMNHDYIYYIRKPGNYIHDFLVTEFYRELSKRSKILNFVVEKELGKIRPDAIFGFEVNSKQHLGLLEVEISHKGFDFEKYEIFYCTEAYKDFFPVMPVVYIVGRNIKIPKTLRVAYTILDTELSNFKL